MGFSRGFRAGLFSRSLAAVLCFVLVPPTPGWAQVELPSAPEAALPAAAPVETVAGPELPAPPPLSAAPSLPPASLSQDPAALSRGLSAAPNDEASGLRGLAKDARDDGRSTPACKDAAPLNRFWDRSGHLQSAPENPPDTEKWNDPEIWDKDKPLEAEAGAPNAISELSLEPPAGRTYHPSPADWRDQVLYSVLIDRFSPGGAPKTAGDPANGHSWHGGTLRGVIEKLDYIRGTGATTVVLSSLLLSAPGGYHGYWPVHHLAIEPRFGTMADFKELVDKAHAKGLYVVFDLPLNHTGKIFEYKDGNPHWAGDVPRDVRWLRKYRPAELAKDERFYRRGAIIDWNDPVQATRGDFPIDLRHFNFSDAATQDALIAVSKWWLKETDVDGFRLDAYKHIDPRFWKRFHAELGEYAAKLGKKNFLRIGEIWTGSEQELADRMKADGLPSAFGFPAYMRDNAALHGKGPTRALEDSQHEAAKVFGDAAGSLVRFLDNQDLYRFMRADTPVGLLKTALAYTLYSTGIPFIYYGTEQALRQAVETMDPGGPDSVRNREDMFPEGLYKSESSAGDKFDANSETYRWLAKLAAVRAALEPLRRGEQYLRWSEPAGPGLFAFSRILGGQEVLVALNTHAEERSAKMWVDHGLSPPKTDFVDLLDPSFQTKVRGLDGGSKLSVRVPGYGVRVLVRKPETPAKKSAVKAAADELSTDMRRRMSVDKKIVLVQAGRAPIETTLSQLPQALAGTGFAAEFNKNGQLRVLQADGTPEADAASVKAALAAAGLSSSDARTRTERLPVEAAKSAEPDAPEMGWKELAIRGLIGASVAGYFIAAHGWAHWLAAMAIGGWAAHVDRLARETVYVLKTFRAAIRDSKRPTWSEAAGGIVGKIVPGLFNIGVFVASYKGHPWALAAAVVLSLAVETFHGVWVDTWNNLQAKIGSRRGASYQSLFNFFYSQLIGCLFRLVAFVALTNVAAPWSFAYWKAIGAMTIIGTFCGTLGFRGLTTLYEKGRVARRGRSLLQQVRDCFFVIIGPIFNSGHVATTIILFSAQQAVDLALFGLSRKARTRPIVYVVDDAVARSSAFDGAVLHPLPPLQAAWREVKNSMFVRPWLSLWRRLRRAPKK